MVLFNNFFLWNSSQNRSQMIGENSGEIAHEANKKPQDQVEIGVIITKEDEGCRPTKNRT